MKLLSVVHLHVMMKLSALLTTIGLEAGFIFHSNTVYFNHMLDGIFIRRTLL